jgi:hypothetical protein
MKQVRRIRHRCTNQWSKDWPRYGGRGIELHFTGPELEAWIRENRFAWTGFQIHRINNDRHYSLNNIVLIPASLHQASHHDSCPI